MRKKDSGSLSVELSDGTKMPQIGFGTFKIPANVTQSAVEEALQIGYRLIDTAAAYDNEKGVGAALRASGMVNHVFVTTKLRNVDQGFDSALRAFDESRKRLGVDIVDLYLIHWPVPRWDRYVDTWRALVRLREEGVVRAIGVSNFMAEHLERIVRETGVVPSVNQIEAHPSYSQPNLRACCAGLGVAVEAYAPLGRGVDMTSEVVMSVAKAHAVTPAQAILRWHIQNGHVCIPKSVHVDRMCENIALDGFNLSDSEMSSIEALNMSGHRLFGDPNTFEALQTSEDMAARGNL